ncbi:MAG: hypothetical protein LBJ76_06455 [Candidatus Accumulibacter sp.]|jgi:hypothetical protein|nr:hypothetical protein [Accumulibacter sp.]
MSRALSSVSWPQRAIGSHLLKNAFDLCRYLGFVGPRKRVFDPNVQAIFHPNDRFWHPGRNLEGAELL